jgi:AAHS family 4-hydroxybenzoate transporter-like MFS transporter
LGRKRVLLGSVAAFGVLTLATVWTRTIFEVALLRGIAGIFLSAAIPASSALLADWAPARLRAALITIAFTGFGAGSSMSSVVVLFILGPYGWQGVFWVSGLAPLVLLPLFWFGTRESLQVRARRDASDPQLLGDVARMRPDLDLTGISGLSLEEGVGVSRSRLRQLFGPGRSVVTLLVWAIYFVALANIAVLSSWTSAFFNTLSGISLQRVAALDLVQFPAGLVGSLTIGFLMDRFRSADVLALVYLVYAAVTATLGYLPFGSPAMVVMFVVWGYCKIAGQAGINAICANVYPSNIRSTGLGWAYGMGRVGGLPAPLIGGWALGAHLPLGEVFLFVAAMPAILAVLLFALGLTPAAQASTLK